MSSGKVLWASELCIDCDACIKTCTHHATPKTQEMSAEEVFQLVSSYQPFIRGVTVSGGECSLWPEFVRELFELCHEAGLTTLMDSNGMADFSSMPELMDACDGVMLDVKAWDKQLHQQLTGVSNEQVKANLVWLQHAHKLEELRVVVVEGWNDPETIIEQSAAALKDSCATARIKLIRFRNFGVRGVLEHASSPSDERMDELARLARGCGFGEVVVS